MLSYFFTPCSMGLNSCYASVCPDNSVLTLQLIYSPLSGQSADPASFLPTLSFTNLRLRFLRFSSSNTLLGPANPDGFYAVYDIMVDGACICDGEIISPAQVSSFIMCTIKILLEVASCPMYHDLYVIFISAIIMLQYTNPNSFRLAQIREIMFISN